MTNQSKEKQLQLDFQATCEIVSEYRRLGDDVKAQAILDKALERHPREISFLLMSARLNASLGNYDEAWSLVERAKAVSPDNASVYILEGWLYNEKGDVSAAIDSLNLAQFHSVTDAEIAVIKGYKAFYTKDWLNSVRNFTVATEKIDPDPGINSVLSQSLLHLKRYKEAHALIKKALDTEPSSYSSLLTLGTLEELLGNKANAIRAYEAAKQVNPASTFAEVRLLRLDIMTFKWKSAWMRFMDVLRKGGIYHSRPTVV
jgi:tetratricopeptide (TPR) repeat protein